MLKGFEGRELTFTFHSWAPELRQSVGGQEAAFASAVVASHGVGAGGVGGAHGGVHALLHI